MKYFVFIFLFLISCRKSDSKDEYSRFSVDENLSKQDTFKLLSKLPENKNNFDELTNSKTSAVTQTLTFTNTKYTNDKRYIYFDNYKAEAKIINDSLHIFINNNNGQFGNGILIKVFDGQYLIKNIDPNTIRNRLKFVAYPLNEEKLILNKLKYQKNDSVFGYINYTCQITPALSKNMKGYFRSKVQ